MSDGITYELLRMRLGDGEETTVYLVRHPLATTAVRVVCISRSRRGSITGAPPTTSRRPSSVDSSCATPTDRSARFASMAHSSSTSA